MRICLIVLVTLLLGACSPSLISLPEPTQIPPAGEVEKSPTEASANTDEPVALAVADLSTRFALDPAGVRLLSIESQLWPDSALGCPHTGEAYSQQTVPGYRITLAADNQEYIYHTDMDSTVILCTEEDLPSFPVTPGEIDDGEPWMPVD